MIAGGLVMELILSRTPNGLELELEFYKTSCVISSQKEDKLQNLEKEAKLF